MLLATLLALPVMGMPALPDGFYRPSGSETFDSPAYTALQDSLGYVWIGTQNGLLRYDGCHVLRYTYIPGDSRSLCNNHVNTLLYCPDSGRMVVGTDTGVSVYDFASDSFSTLSACGYLQTKALLRDEDTLYVGTVKGVLRFTLPDGKPDAGMQPDGDFISDDHTACIRKIGSNIFFGGYDCFYRRSEDGVTVRYALGTSRKLVLDIMGGGTDSSKLWLGTEQGLLVYDLEQGRSETLIGNIPVKYFFRNVDGSLWICTDNGLFINDGRKTVRFGHETENSGSLPDNVVWYVAGGRDGSLFICTDSGLTMPEISGYADFRPLSSFTGVRDGLNVVTMSEDREGNLWLGGMNGLVMYGSNGHAGRWYRADRGPEDMRLSHNKVRDLLDDGSGLFIVSDGGLDRLDYRTRKIRHLDLLDPSGERYITWMYCLEEDSAGRLWAGTFDGLTMIEDKERLLREGQYRAGRLFNQTSSPGISGNAVMDAAMADGFGAVLSNGMVDMVTVTPEGPGMSYVDLPEGLYATTLAADRDRIWIGTSRGVFCLTEDGTAERIPGPEMYADAIAVGNDRVIVTSDRTVSVYDRVSGQWSHLPFVDRPLFCGLVTETGMVYIGSADGYYECRPEGLPEAPGHSRISVTSLFIGNDRVETGKEYDGNIVLSGNLAASSGITLKHDQNTFSIEYSSFDFSGRDEDFVYRLAGFDDSWQRTSEHRAVFINVPGGNYRFEVAEAPADGSAPAEVTSLPVKVRKIWYATAFAGISYVLVFLGLCAWVFYYLRMRHQLQIEHMERDRAMKTADMKTEFLANVSHEFKSPLSIILGFTGRMIASESDALRSRELNTVRLNAEKIHLLLDQMIRFNNDTPGATLFIPSATSLQEMAASVFNGYADAFADKNVNARFVSDDIGYIFMIDRVRMESALSNLLSNALKFTPPGGSVLMSVTVSDQTDDMLYADVKVEDTGFGIAPEELPLIFNRYYRASSSRNTDPGGSGIGLSLVKEIVEQHKGKVWAESEPGKGTAFTVRLSTMKADSFVLKPDGREEFSLHSLSNVWQHDRKPIILLVEDNPDIRDLITASLGKDYVFLSAGDGKTGLEIVGKEKVDLVITDLAMPVMDGLAMSRAIRNALDTTFLPIIILTGKNDEKTELKSFEYADAFISKPFSISYLNNRIIQLLIKHEQYLAKVRQQKMLEPAAVDSGKSYDEELLQNVVDIVNRHIEDPAFSASVLCSESRYGSKQIYRKIKQLTGMGIVEFIRDTRLQRAAQYLAQGKLSVTEVMYKSGFTTASYFSKCFREKYGVTPSDYASRSRDAT